MVQGSKKKLTDKIFQAAQNTDHRQTGFSKSIIVDGWRKEDRRPDKECCHFRLKKNASQTNNNGRPKRREKIERQGIIMIESAFFDKRRRNATERNLSLGATLTSVGMLLVEVASAPHLRVEQARHQLVHDVLQRLVRLQVQVRLSLVYLHLAYRTVTLRLQVQDYATATDCNTQHIVLQYVQQ